jgi:hypothetical protein
MRDAASSWLTQLVAITTWRQSMISQRSEAYQILITSIDVWKVVFLCWSNEFCRPCVWVCESLNMAIVCWNQRSAVEQAFWHGNY